MELCVQARKDFGSFTLDVDLTATQDAVGIYGPSGSGKSTIVGLIAGLVHPDAGSIRLNDEVLCDARSYVPPERRRIGVIFQRPNLFPHLSVRDNLLYGQRRCPRQDRTIDVDKLVEVLRIGHLLERDVIRLSGGEQQRVSIGRAVLSNPRLLLMDEPLSGLDDSLRFSIISHLRDVCRTFSIPYLFISHSLLEMRLMAERVFSVAAGRVVEQSTPEELARSRMGQNPVGYINLLRLRRICMAGGMGVYGWGGGELFISAAGGEGEALFELSSKDIILIKQHPAAISARNLLPCTVVKVFRSGNKVGVELACGGDILVAEVVDEAAEELGISAGTQIFAAIKASAFRALGGC